MIEGEKLIQKIASCCHAMAWQSGGAGVDLAGHTLSFLAANPEHIERYMKEGNELWIDRTITFEGGCLSYLANDGEIRMPSDIRKTKDA